MKVTQGIGRTEGKKTGMPLWRVELGSAWAGFQVMQFLPSPDGKFAAKRASGFASRQPLGFRFFFGNRSGH